VENTGKKSFTLLSEVCPSVNLISGNLSHLDSFLQNSDSEFYKSSTDFSVPNYSQQDATFLDLFIFTNVLNVSGGFLRPSSGAHNCTHSFKYCQPILVLAATVEETELFQSLILGQACID
jgi:hypothetical protein